VWVRPMARTQAVAGGAALLAALVLGGCSSDATSTSSPTPTPSETSTSASPSPSRSTTPTPSESSTIPAAARKNTPEGAEAFVRFFVKQFNRAWTTPQPGLIASLSDRRCRFCANTESTSETLDSRDERYETPPLTLKGAQAFSGAPSGQIFVNAELVQNKAAVVDSAGGLVHQDVRKALPSNIVLLWSGDRWVVLELEEA